MQTAKANGGHAAGARGAGKAAGKAWQGPGAGQWQEQPLAPGPAPGAQVLSSDYQVLSSAT